MKDHRFGKIVIFVNGLVPLSLLCFDAWRGRLGANPPEFVIHTTGILAIIFLMLSLAVTPLRKISGQNWIGHFRKLLGLFAFFYGCLHLIAYSWFDKGLQIGAIVKDVFDRKFIFFGMSCFLAMLPLALTSTSGAVKMLGAKRWRLLHRLAYAAGILAVIHYWMFVKIDVTLPVIFAVIVTILLGARIVLYFVKSTPSVKPRGAATE